jgi:hypothetical protein
MAGCRVGTGSLAAEVTRGRPWRGHPSGGAPIQGSAPRGGRWGWRMRPRLPALAGGGSGPGGWGAWQELRSAVLVVDAGTVLSFTRVDQGGTFGGRLQAGLRLQLEAMAQGTTLLPLIPCPSPHASTDVQEMDQGDLATGAGPWPPPQPCGWGWNGGWSRPSGRRPGRPPAHGWCSRGDRHPVPPAVSPELELLGFSVAHKPLLCLGSLALLRPAPGTGPIGRGA